MEENLETYREPKYTFNWLGIQSLYVLGLGMVLAFVAKGIDVIAQVRMDEGWLQKNDFPLVSQSTAYCFAVVVITLVSLMLVELVYRKSIHKIQYALIGMALTLFYLLLLAMSEKMAYELAYSLVTAMTVILITAFVKGLTRNRGAVVLTAGILVVEYGLVFLLISWGSTALLIGSMVLFGIIGLAMYLTLKLRVENDELVIK